MSTKYTAIADELESRWRDYPKGEQLPAERTLAAEFKVTPVTLRKALDVLEDRGVVERIPRRGTFISRGLQRIHKTPTLSSFSQEMRDCGYVPSTRLLAVGVQTASDEVAAALAIPQQASVLTVERLRLADGDPICLELSYLPAQFETQLSTQDLETSLHDALARLGHRPASGKRTATAVALDPRAAMLLGLPAGSPALAMVHVFLDKHGTPVEWVRSLYRPDRYEVSFMVNFIAAEPDSPT